MGALLDGVRVVDLTDGFGALTARVLGELGADVVRVEAPGGGVGVSRTPRSSDGIGLHHAYRNAGKTIVELDDADDDARAELDLLIDGASVVIVSSGGWGSAVGNFGASALSERHPHAVVTSLTPYGLTGPAAGWSATELVTQAMAGVVYRAGVPELPPVAAPGSYCEDVGAVTAALAAVLALFQGRHDGVGQLLDVSAVLALAQCTDTALPLWSLLRNDQTRLGAGLYPLFQCRDGLARLVLPMSPRDWRSLIAWLGSPPEWAGPEWEGPMLAPPERALVLARLPERFAGLTRDEVAASGDAAGVRITPVLTPAEVLDNEHVTARQTFARLEVAPGRRGAVMAGMFGVDGNRCTVGGPARRVPALPTWSTAARGAGARGGAPPLEGVRVLDLGIGVAAPEAGRVLAEWGADVIKVESRSRPDFQRMVMGGEMNPAFASPNRCKRALAADLSSEAGRELVVRLLPNVDVVLENSATGVMERLGLGWDAISAANPRAVLVSSQLFGSRGPWAWRKGYGPSARAIGGLTWLWAHGPDAPRGVMTIHPDHLAGRLGAISAVAGLLARERTGIGCHVDIAQFEAVAALLGDLLLAESMQPGSAVPAGNRSTEFAPWNLFRCADDERGAETWLALCVTDDPAWEAVRRIAGDRLVGGPGWAATAGRLADRERLEQAVGAWLRGCDPAELEVELQSAGVAAAQALHPRLQSVHPQFVARGYPVTVEQPGAGTLVFEGPAFEGTRLGRPRCGPAPLLGEHTAEICRDDLGLSEAEIRRLVDGGAIDPP